MDDVKSEVERIKAAIESGGRNEDKSYYRVVGGVFARVSH